ncbi:MAG: basic amino acid ABC transporter substrate-binding protein [Elusimicrobia bacterium]|nr:basic amino acid ABC transporter substrate-binding protein [Elusimicrobiota bacterium]
MFLNQTRKCPRKSQGKSICTKTLNLFSFLLVVILTACSVENTKVLKIGTDATYPPFETVAGEGKVVGFDIDLMTAIAKEIGKEPQFIVVPFDGIISGLKQRKYDAVISAMTITEDRAKEVSFSKPYYLAGQSIAVSKDEQNIKGLEGLVGKRIGVQLGTTGEMEAKKIKNAKVVSFDNISAAFLDLENKKLDAIINDVPTNKSIIITRPGKFKTVGKLLTKEYYGIAIRKDNKELLDKVNSAIAKLEKTGDLKKLEIKWQIGGK